MLTQEIETNVQPEKQDRRGAKTLPEAARPFQFKPGQTGNPRGRRPLGITLAQHIRDIGSEELKSELTRLDAAIRAAYEKARKGNISALALLLDRGWGKPIQPVVDATRLLQEEVLKQGLDAAALTDDPVLRTIVGFLGSAGETASLPEPRAAEDSAVSSREEGEQSRAPSDAT